MGYLIMDCLDDLILVESFATAEEAIAQAEKEWDYLSSYDKKIRTGFYVLESVNEDPEAEDHFDGTIIKVFK